MMNGASMDRGREGSSLREPFAVAPRVLFVDDDPSMCALLQAQLTRRNFEIQPASSASEALRLLDATEIDVVLTDVVMEGDRKSTRLNSSHLVISYAVFCLKKKKKRQRNT